MSTHYRHLVLADRIEIEKLIDQDFSLSAIAEQIGVHSRMQLSPETFYSWIYSPRQKHRQLWQYLLSGDKRRRRMSGRRVHSERIKFRASIHDRPEEVDSREDLVFGI